MLGVFTIEKAIQASAVVLTSTFSRRMGRLRLIKLLYIADRESIQETAHSITADDVYAMDHGPVLTNIYNCIRARGPLASDWERYIQSLGPREIEVAVEPGTGLLSRWEEAKLREVTRRYEQWEDYELAELTHRFPEYINNKPPQGSSRPIPERDILVAVGLGEDADEIIAEAESFAETVRLVANVR